MASGNLSLEQRKIVDTCVRDVIRFSAAVSLFLAILLFFLFGRYISVAYLSGTLVSMLNFLLLRHQAEFLVKKVDARRLLVVVLGGYLIRFGLMGAFLFFVGTYGIRYLLAAGLGLLSIRIGILFYGLFFPE